MKFRMAIVTLCGSALLSASNTGFAQNASDSGAMAASSARPASNNKAANRKLAKDVRRALSRARDISVANINVRAVNGVVTLAGTVPDESQIDKVTKIAQGVAGVTAVKNALTIRPVGQ
jgi:hyperosmotically inducible periplasmic protein